MRLTELLDALDSPGLQVWSAVLLIALIGWLLVWRSPAADAKRDCESRYAAATTLADTLRIDRQGSGAGTRMGPWNCGMLRRTQ